MYLGPLSCAMDFTLDLFIQYLKYSSFRIGMNVMHGSNFQWQSMNLADDNTIYLWICAGEVDCECERKRSS